MNLYHIASDSLLHLFLSVPNLFLFADCWLYFKLNVLFYLPLQCEALCKGFIQRCYINKVIIIIIIIILNTDRYHWLSFKHRHTYTLPTTI